MGEVYKARDTRLDRIVAVKVLPDVLAADPQFRDRFDREARSISRLDHPHICALYDVGAQGGTAYLVMQYLEGETLADRLAKGALPIEQALQIAIQIADALVTAHRAGIIHRDLKPANIMLTKSGTKLLDFGLAKLRPATMPAGGLTAPAQAPLTGEGSILGTLHYMAPEQLEGKDTDARSDLFALGAVLYEMLTGQRAFAGATPASVVAAILEREPIAISALRPVTPPLLDEIVKRCLAKHPDDRWQSASDLAFALKSVGERSPGHVTPATDEHQAARKARLAWQLAAMAAVIALASVALAVFAGSRPTTSRLQQSPVRFQLSELLAASTLDPQRSFAISSDGTRVVYVADRGGTPMLYLRDLSSTQPTLIAGTEDAFAPFFSPDGQRIGFFTNGQLKTIAINGGPPTILDEVTAARGGTWASGDTIIYSPATDAGLWRVAAGGGPPTLVAQPDASKGERSYRWPSMLPGGDAVVFTIAMSDIRSFDDARLAVRSLRTGEQHEILSGGSCATYSERGDLLYGRAGALFAVPFDVKKQVLAGTPHPVFDGVVTYPITGAAQYALAENGTLLYIAGKSESPEGRLSWVTRDGRATRLDVPALPFQSVSLSPDGHRAALNIDGANANVWILNIDRTDLTRLTLRWSNNNAAWTADPSRVAFTSQLAGVRSLFWQRIDGQTAAEPVLASPPPFRDIGRSTWTRDGKVVVFDAERAGSGRSLWVARLDGDRTPRGLHQTPFEEKDPTISPDGRWLAYQSNETGAAEIYVQAFPSPGRKWTISIDGGIQPVWSRDSHELFYRHGDAIMGVKIETSGSFSATRPQLVFQTGKGLTISTAIGSTFFPYDVAPDGKFLVVERMPSSMPARPITVVLNWLHERM